MLLYEGGTSVTQSIQSRGFQKTINQSNKGAASLPSLNVSDLERLFLWTSTSLDLGFICQLITTVDVVGSSLVAVHSRDIEKSALSVNNQSGVKFSNMHIKLLSGRTSTFLRLLPPVVTGAPRGQTDNVATSLFTGPSTPIKSPCECEQV